MTLRNGDYEINGNSITIKKDVLEKWHEHYGKVSRENFDYMQAYFAGKADDVLDLLKLFEPLEP